MEEGNVVVVVEECVVDVNANGGGEIGDEGVEEIEDGEGVEAV